MAEVSAPPERGTSSRSQDEQAEGAQEKAQEAVGQAQETVQEKAQEAKQQAGSKVREQVDQRSNQAGEQVTTTATDLKSVGEELRKQGKETPAKLADQAAERTEQVGKYLTESDADKILSDVEDFARRQPWAVVAGGLALGFVASRFLKASSSQRYSERQSRELPSGNGPGGSANGSGSHEAVAPPAPESRVVATASDEGVEIR
jgi:ElaB/YqjD/DUF883 family membrane-anchored ribosome-binding protein